MPRPSGPFGLYNQAKPRDLRFYGPFVEMFFDGAKRLADLSRHERVLWRGVEEPVLSEAEGTSAMLKESQPRHGPAQWTDLLLAASTFANILSRAA